MSLNPQSKPNPAIHNNRYTAKKKKDNKQKSKRKRRLYNLINRGFVYLASFLLPFLFSTKHGFLKKAFCLVQTYFYFKRVTAGGHTETLKDKEKNI